MMNPITTFLVYSAEEGGYWARNIKGNMFTQGENHTEIIDNIKDVLYVSYEGVNVPNEIKVIYVLREDNMMI